MTKMITDPKESCDDRRLQPGGVVVESNGETPGVVNGKRKNRTMQVEER